MNHKVLLAHPGTQHSHQLAKQLSERNLLYEFWTGFALAENSRMSKFMLASLPQSWKKKLANRLFKDVPTEFIHILPFLEARALLEIRYGKAPQQVFYKRNAAFQKKIPSSSIRNASALISFDTSSWILAEKAYEINKPFFVDQTIAHPKTRESALQKVIERYPEWSEKIIPRTPKMLMHDEQEYVLATKVIVPSAYTAKTLQQNGVPENKIIVNPFGVDLINFRPSALKRPDRPLRFIFVGAVMARKGVPLLIQAWQALNLQNCELWLVGSISPHARSLIPNLPNLKIFGKIAHHLLPNLMGECDIFVFPSYCEGLPRVLLEALACGLPVITTDAVADSALVKDYQEGFVIPAGNLDLLCNAMQYFNHKPEHIATMSKNARRQAENYTWKSYGDGWHRILQENS